MTMGIALAVSFFYDLTTLTVGTEEIRATTMAAGQEIVINHLDWSTLRTGDAPRLMDTLPVNGEITSYMDTVEAALTKESLLPISRLQARTVFYELPAIVGVSARTGTSSSFLDMLDIYKDVWLQREAIYIVESKYESYNY